MTSRGQAGGRTPGRGQCFLTTRIVSAGNISRLAPMILALFTSEQYRVPAPPLHPRRRRTRLPPRAHRGDHRPPPQAGSRDLLTPANAPTPTRSRTGTGCRDPVNLPSRSRSQMLIAATCTVRSTPAATRRHRPSRSSSGSLRSAGIGPPQPAPMGGFGTAPSPCTLRDPATASRIPTARFVVGGL